MATPTLASRLKSLLAERGFVTPYTPSDIPEVDATITEFAQAHAVTMTELRHSLDLSILETQATGHIKALADLAEICGELSLYLVQAARTGEAIPAEILSNSTSTITRAFRTVDTIKRLWVTDTPSGVM